MKRFAAVTALFFITACLYAEDPAGLPEGEIFSRPLVAETMDAFRTACARLAEHSLIRGSFEQEKTLSRLNRSLKSSGDFIIAAGLGMVWDTAKPFPSAMTLGKDFIIQSRPGGQKTVLSAEGNETFIRLAEVISAVFSGSASKLLDNFEVYFSGGGNNDRENTGAPFSWELGLLPLDRAIGSFAERITMKGDAAIRNILIHEQNGDTIQYRLSGHNYPAELSAHEKANFSLP